MNKKGFTLMELLGVIIILSLLTTIAIVGVTRIVKNSKEQLSETQMESIRLAAEIWGADNEKYLPNNNECVYMTLNDLKNFAVIDENVFNIKNNKKLAENMAIKISASLNKFNKINYVYEVNSDEIDDCIKINFNYLEPENVIAVENPTINGAPVGITPEVNENGDFIPGSTFNIKVNDEDTDGSIFYVLSNDGEYVNLIAQQNITIDGEFTSEPQDNDEWYVTSTISYDNRYGPTTAYTYLSQATSNWTNIPIIESFNYLDEGNQSNSSYGYQGITTTLNEISGNYITTITPYSSDYGNPITYKNMRARLPYFSEITNNTSCTPTTNGSCPLWVVNYLASVSYYSTSDGKVNSIGTNYGYWTLSSYPDISKSARNVSVNGYVNGSTTSFANHEVRPIITVLKADLLRVM